VHNSEIFRPGLQFFNRAGRPITFDPFANPSCVFLDDDGGAETESDVARVQDEISQINVCDQHAIDMLRSKFTGVGPLVSARLLEMIDAGEIQKKEQLPDEYRVQLEGFLPPGE